MMTYWLRVKNLILAISLVAVTSLAGPASAEVWTDEDDYSPGSVVTISGDNSDDAGYMNGETVVVAVQGPNGYEASCSAVVGDYGDWSCPVTLWSNVSAIGSYTYTATGRDSGVVQSGQFEDGLGHNHSCALLEDRTMECWGENNYGQLGDGSTTNSNIPVSVTGLTGDVAQISSGSAHTCALLVDGSVWCWGRNNRGQLGNGTYVNSIAPVNPISSAVQIAAGVEYTCALISDGSVRCWGDSQRGQLGDGTFGSNSLPVLVAGLGSDIAQISAGEWHACALHDDGSVSCWGYNYVGSLGNGTFSLTAPFAIPTPVMVSALGNNVTQISASYEHTCALLIDKTVWCWGRNDSGQLGQGFHDTSFPYGSAVPAPTLSLGNDAIQISGGGWQTCVLLTNGSVSCWGYNGQGQLGRGSYSPNFSASPGSVLGLSADVLQVSLGGNHVCVLLAGASMQCWGYNPAGQLGNGTFSTTSPYGIHTPTAVIGLAENVIALPDTEPLLTPPLIITTNSPLPDGFVGLPYSLTLAAEGGVEPYSWSVSSGALPPGLTFNPSTGEISGTPTTAGTFGFTISVTDQTQTTVFKEFGLEPPPSDGTAGTGYNQPLAVADTPPDGETPSCTNYIVISGDLPDGLTLDPLTGVLSGTPLDGGEYTITVQCAVDSVQTATKEFTITINNPLPALTGLDPSSRRAETGPFVLTLFGTGFVQSSIARWNGSDRPTTYISSTELQAAIAAADIEYEGTAAVTVFNPEPIGGVSNELTFTIDPPNNPPTVDAGGDYNGFEGVGINLYPIADDPEDDPLSYSWSVDSVLCTFSDETTAEPTLTCADDGFYSVELMVNDGIHDPVTSDPAWVTVANVAPVITGFAPNTPNPVVEIGAEFDFTAVFSDPAAAYDSYICHFDWDNSGTEDAADAVAYGVVEGTCGATVSYSQPGVYTAKVVVSDEDGGSSTAAAYEFVVVYDPDAGFVTGGGWIDSPPGAYAGDSQMTGKATFGFVAKYQKGVNVPDGNTQFQFKTANLSFSSNSYNWLVIAGASAKFKGTGTINGSGNYGFMITATDEKLTPSTDADLFRIKIWDKNAGDGVVYDNKMGSSDSSNDGTAIGGGAIVIHKK